MGPQVLRDACDACHKNKSKCISSGGPCDSCRERGTSCQFSQRNKMGRPRTRSGSTARTTRRQRMRRDSATHASAHSRSRSDGARPLTPETQSLSSDDLDELPSMQRWLLSPFDPNGNSLMNSGAGSLATPAWTPQPVLSDQVQIVNDCQPGASSASYAYGSVDLVDQAQFADLLAVGGVVSAASAADCVWPTVEQLPTSSTFEQPEPLHPENHTSAHLQLPQILFQLRTFSQALRSRAGSEGQKNQIIETVSSLCDITRSSRTFWSSNGQLPSPDLVILATTVSVAVEIYSVLAEELSTTCSSWLDCERPQTQVFLDFHATAFAMDLHLVELREALNMTGVAAYDAHTTQATEHVHTTVKELLRKCETY